MLYKPKEFHMYHFLKGRRTFSKQEEKNFYTLKQGLKGEKLFSERISQQLKSNYNAIDGLLLEHNGTLFQLDKVLIFQNQLFLLEIKFFQGEFELRDDHLYYYNKDTKYRNPLHQLKRSELVFRELLLHLGVNFKINPYIIFVHPEFTLYQAQRNLPIILPTQINHFIKKLNDIPGKLTKQHDTFANKLKKLHMKESPYTRYPKYSYSSLKKGVFCNKCRQSMQLNWRVFHCPKCLVKEGTDSVVLRHVVEFSILFPHEKVTKAKIHEWMAGALSDATIRSKLTKYMDRVINGKYTYYCFKDKPNE